jgi:hypothetical protein
MPENSLNERLRLNEFFENSLNEQLTPVNSLNEHLTPASARSVGSRHRSVWVTGGGWGGGEWSGRTEQQISRTKV